MTTPTPHRPDARWRRLLRRAAACAAISAALALLAGSAAAVTVTVREEATVSGDRITLGEIALIADADAQALAELEAIPVGAAPLAGASRRLSLDSVCVQLRRSGFDPDALHLAGARHVTVTRAAEVVTGAEIERVAREAVLAQQPEGGEIVVTCARPPADVLVPQGGVTLDPQLIGSARGPSRLVRVTIAVDGARVTGVTLCLRAERYEDILVAARDIARGETLAADAVTFERRDVLPVSGTPLRDLSEIAGRRAKVRLSAGAVLTARAVERIPVIQRGDPVLVTLRLGAVRLTLAGLARSTAGVGEAVTILNPASKRELTARAVGKGAAEMQLQTGEK